MLCFTCWKFKGNGFMCWFVLSFLPKNFIHLCCHNCSFWSRTSGYLSEEIQMDHREQVRNRMQTCLPVLIPRVAIYMGIEVDVIHWMWSWTALLEQGFGQEDLQSSLPTSTIWMKVARLLSAVCMFSYINKHWRYGWSFMLYFENIEGKTGILAVLCPFQSVTGPVEGRFFLFQIMTHFLILIGKCFEYFKICLVLFCLQSYPLPYFYMVTLPSKGKRM